MQVTKSFCVELAASVFTVAGIYCGTTNLSGVILYGIGIVFWIWLMFIRGLWGILPLNIATSAVTILNLYRFMR